MCIWDVLPYTSSFSNDKPSRLNAPDSPLLHNALRTSMARRPLLDFEKPLVELEEQIEQIRQLAKDSEVDVSQQLLQLETLAARRRE